MKCGSDSRTRNTFGSQNNNNKNTNVFDRAPTAAPTGPRVPLVNRMSISGQPVLPPPQSQNFGFHGASANGGQALRPAKQQNSKQNACKNFLDGRCQKSEEECRYAHTACPVGIVADVQTPNPADPGMASGKVAKVVELVAPKCFEQGKHCRGFPWCICRRTCSCLSRRKQPALNAKTASDYLQGILKAASRKNQQGNGKIQPAAKPTAKPQSEIPCLFQKKNLQGCTNATCPYKHDPPKGSGGAGGGRAGAGAGGGTWSYVKKIFGGGAGR
jgi:hypothetical protein